MILCDTGPLVALIDRDDPYHDRCQAALPLLGSHSLVTTIPCLTEAMYLLHRAGKLAAQEELWKFIDDQLITIHPDDAKNLASIRELMRRFYDLPMDIADASIIAAAESLSIDTVFTFDSHFRIYKTASGRSLNVVT